MANVLASPQEFAGQYDLMVTTFYYLSELEQVLRSTKHKDLIGAHTTPTHDKLLKIVRLHPQAIGLVCETASATDTLSHIAQAYHRSATVIPAQVEDQPCVQSLFTKVDAIIVTQSCHQRLMQLQPAVPVISVAFTIEQQSVDFLRRGIAALIAEEARNSP